MIGSYPLSEFDSTLIIPNAQRGAIGHLGMYSDTKDHMEMYPDIFHQYVHLEQFNEDLVYTIPETLALKVLKITHTGLPIKIIMDIIISASSTIEEVTIKTNDKCIELIPFAMQINTIKKIKIYDNTTLEDFHKILLFLSEAFTELHIYASDISGGNGHLYQTHITLISDNIQIQFVLQWVITSSNLHDIFTICTNISILELSENFNSEFPIYPYLDDISIIFSKQLTKVILTDEQADTNIIIAKLFDKIPTLAYVLFKDN